MRMILFCLKKKMVSCVLYVLIKFLCFAEGALPPNDPAENEGDPHEWPPNGRGIEMIISLVLPKSHGIASKKSFVLADPIGVGGEGEMLTGPLYFICGDETGDEIFGGIIEFYQRGAYICTIPEEFDGKVLTICLSRDGTNPITEPYTFLYAKIV